MQKKSIDPIVLTYSNFNQEINNGNNFLTTEQGNNLEQLIFNWSEHLVSNPANVNKRLYINLLNITNEYGINYTFRNVDIGEIRLPAIKDGCDFHLFGSTVGVIKFTSSQKASKAKIIRGDGNSSITSLSFNGLDFRNDDSDSLGVYNLDITNLHLAHSTNLSEKVQISACHIENLLISSSDLGKLQFYGNTIGNLYVRDSVIYRIIPLGTVIQKVHRYIESVPEFSDRSIELPYSEMANISRQLKSAFDESKSFLDGDRFYAEEMLNILLDTNGKLLSKPLLFLHYVSSKFGTSWIRAVIFILVVGLAKFLLEHCMLCVEFKTLVTGVIDNINPYINFQEVKESKGSMSLFQLVYLIFLSYGIYQFILSVRRISKR